MKLLGKLPDRYINWKIAREESLVKEGWEAEPPLFYWGLVRLLVSFVALVGAELLPGPWDTVCWGVAGAAVGASALITHRVARAYRNGWLDGRQRFIEGFTKTHNPRELAQLINHCAEYDLIHVLGLMEPEAPDSPEGLQ